MERCLSTDQIDRITAALRERLSPKRVLHSLGATHAAIDLAFRWNVDPSKALAAGLLHDIAKEDDREKQRERIEKSDGGMDPEYADHPAIWHALAGAIIAREDFGLRCEEVERSIRLHPTGEAEMSALDQIIFLADYIEPTRVWEGVGALRDLARRDLRAATDSAALTKTQYVEKSGKALQACSQRALQKARSRIDSKNPALAPTPRKETKSD